MDLWFILFLLLKNDKFPKHYDNSDNIKYPLKQNITNIKKYQKNIYIYIFLIINAMQVLYFMFTFACVSSGDVHLLQS